MRYNTIRKMDISNGPGIRVSVFVQGCTHHCKNCFNQETWDFTSGKPWTQETNEKILDYLSDTHRVGLSLLGGDPFCLLKYKKDNEPNYLLDLVKEVKERFPDKTIWLWTGYLWEEFFPFTEKDTSLLDNDLYNAVNELLSYIDVIVDGPYVEEYKDMRLKYAGSINQRVIDVKESFKNNRVCIYNK